MINEKSAVILFSTILLIFPTLPAILSQPDRIQDARVLLDHGDFNRARALLELLPASSQGTEAWFLLGKLNYLSGEVDKAAEWLEKASKAKPDNSQYSLWLARALGRRAEQASPFRAPFLARRACDAFRAAVDLDPNDLDARDDLLSYYLEAPGFLGGGKERATALVEQIKDVHPCHYLVQSAQICEKEQSLEQGEASLQKAASLNPPCIGGILALAEFYQKRQQHSRARETFLRAVQKFPESASAHFEFGQFEIETGGNLESGCQELEAFLKLYSSGNPYPFEAYYWLGERYLKLNQPAEAIGQFEQALKLFSAHSPSQKGLAEARQQLNNPRKQR
jgi:tetratricopeptide (TPR) repeat protein